MKSEALSAERYVGRRLVGTCRPLVVRCNAIHITISAI